MPGDSTNDEARVGAALDRAELINLVFRFTQAIDRRDFEAMARCCAEPFEAKASGFGTVILEVDGLDRFIEGLRRADDANPGGFAQHRYFDPGIELAGDDAEIWLSGEVYNANGASAPEAGEVRVSGLQTRYGARREAAGWRLCSMRARYLWRRALPPSEVPG